MTGSVGASGTSPYVVLRAGACFAGPGQLIGFHRGAPWVSTVRVSQPWAAVEGAEVDPHHLGSFCET